MYCKSLYFHVFFMSQFCDWKLICGNLNSRCMLLSYVNSIHPNISRECWIGKGSNLQIFAKIKFSRIIVNLLYFLLCFPISIEISFWNKNWSNEDQKIVFALSENISFIFSFAKSDFYKFLLFIVWKMTGNDLFFLSEIASWTKMCCTNSDSNVIT